MLEQKELRLLCLLSQEKYQSAQELAEHMKVSERSLRKYINRLDDSIRPFSARIVHKQRRGYILVIEDIARFQTLFAKDKKNIPAESEERVLYLIEHFLNTSGYVKLDDLCEKLFVCRKTITKDLRKVEEYFEENNLKLEKRPYYGTRLIGSEYDKRLCLANYREKHTESFRIFSKNNEDVSMIFTCVQLAVEKTHYHMSENLIQKLLPYLLIATNRIKNRQYVRMDENLLSLCSGKKELALAKACAKSIEDTLDVQFPEDEIYYLAMHIIGSESGSEWAEKNVGVLVPEEINVLVQKILNRVCDTFGVDLRNDLEFRMSLGIHMVPLIVRIRYGLTTINPIADEIKRRYSFSYLMALEACTLMETVLQKNIDCSEVCSVALLFELALERQWVEKKKKVIILVCSNGVNTAKLLAYRMQEIFGDCIGEIRICDSFELKYQEFAGVDYVFTTVPILDYVPVPVSEVGLFLEENDIASIRKILGQNKNAYEAVLRYFPEELFFGQMSFSTKDEVLLFLCQEIAKSENVPSDFYESVIRREKMLKTAFGDMVAIPHPDCLMTENSFAAIVILEEPIEWASGEKIRVVCLTSVTKNERKRDNYFNTAVAEIVTNAENIKRLIAKPSYDTVKEIMRHRFAADELRVKNGS